MRGRPRCLLLAGWAWLALAKIIQGGAIYNPKDFGAKGNGIALDTHAIQQAIDRCAASGGGIVQIPVGTYLTAPILLKSNITLQLDKGAVLIGTSDPADYPVTGENVWQGVMQKRPQALLSATGQSHVRISGEGMVYGSGAPWWKIAQERKKAHQEDPPRPWLVQFTRCQDVLVEGVTLKDSPSYTLVPYFSSDVVIRNIKILAPPDSPNTDGVAPYSSHHVRIEHSVIDSGDDNVAIKSSRPSKPGEDSSVSDITVSDCTFLHGHGATIGADTGGGVHDILMENLRLEGTTYGLRIKSGRGFAGEVYNITYRNITMTSTSPAITISAYYPSVPEHDSAQPVTFGTPKFHDITLSQVTATGGEEAGSVIGLPESPIRNLVLDHVSVSARKGLRVRHATITSRTSDVKVTSGPAWIEEENVQIDRVR